MTLWRGARLAAAKDPWDGRNGLLGCKLQPAGRFAVMHQMTLDVSLLSAVHRVFPQGHFAVLLRLAAQFYGGELVFSKTDSSLTPLGPSSW